MRFPSIPRPRMVSHWSLIVGLLLLSACSSDGDQTAEAPTRSEVVAAYIETGVSEEVATCVAGIGGRHFSNTELMPGAKIDATQAPVLAELFAGCEEAAILGQVEFDEPDSLAFNAEPDSFGDDPALDRLWTACEEGDGDACDKLFEAAPVGSNYEQFGVTCGDRANLLDCSELSEPEITE